MVHAVEKEAAGEAAGCNRAVGLGASTRRSFYYSNGTDERVLVNNIEAFSYDGMCTN